MDYITLSNNLAKSNTEDVVFLLTIYYTSEIQLHATRKMPIKMLCIFRNMHFIQIFTWYGSGMIQYAFINEYM